MTLEFRRSKDQHHIFTNKISDDLHSPPLFLQETEEEDDDDSSQSSESGEASSVAPDTVTDVVGTEEPSETTVEPIEPIAPTIVTDTDTGRGDSMGGNPSDYKSIVYVEEKTYHKIPSLYKSYEYLGAGKRMAPDMIDGNEVEKSMKVYKVQVSLSLHGVSHPQLSKWYPVSLL